MLEDGRMGGCNSLMEELGVARAGCSSVAGHNPGIAMFKVFVHLALALAVHS